MPTIMMIAAFAVLTGIALLFASCLNFNIGEGFVFSASAVIALMFVTGRFSAFTVGIVILVGIAAIGFASYIIGIRKGRTGLSVISNPVMISLFLILIANCLLFHNDYIQHVDELHQWAAAVKYMLSKGRLPIYGDYIGDFSQKYGTSLFHVFFQKFTGYNEAMMYVSATLLYWIGFLMPFGDGKKSWKKICLYILVLEFSFFSMYRYGAKNLYVDIPTIAWSAGVTAWWINKKNNIRKRDIALLVDMLIMIYYFKTYVGLLMDVFIVVGILMSVFLYKYGENSENENKKLRKTIIIPIVVIIIGFMIIAMYLVKSADMVYIKSVANAYAKGLLVKPFSHLSRIRMTLPAITILSFLLMGLCRSLSTNNEYRLRMTWSIVYFVAAEISYIMVLFGAYLFIFSPEESLEVAGGIRYFSIIGMYLFTNALFFILGLDEENNLEGAGRLVPIYVTWALLFFYSCTSTNEFAISMSSLGKGAMDDYSDITKARRQLSQIEEVIQEGDRVYFVDQRSESEFPSNIALYYMENQVSNYLAEPWRFTEKGSVIRLSEREDIDITYLPMFLSDGGYTYIWVYTSDGYFEETLGAMGLDPESVSGAGLYKIVENDVGSLLVLEKVVNF